MAAPFAKTSFSAGEVSPSLWGRTDLGKYHVGASTMRNFFVNYRGGAISRAGTAFVGQCLQPGNAAPPRDIKFQFNVNQGYALEFGDYYMRVKSAGAYVVEPAISVTAASNAIPAQITGSTLALQNGNLANGDWVYLAGLGGITQLNSRTFIAQNVNLIANTFTLTDLFGNPIDSTSFGTYTTGGTFARIFTLVTPYAAVDLPWLKYTQSADVMTLCCVNQMTKTEYPPYDLSRITASNWTLVETTFAASIAAPSNASASSVNNSNDWTIAYVVTAIDAKTGDESVASNIAFVTSAVNPAISANTITVNWNPVPGASSYNVYRADPVYSTGGTAPIPVGALYGFVGTALGTQFQDSNITADFTSVPPTHQNPFARGAITGVVVTAGGANYTQNTVGYTIATATGTGAVLVPIVIPATGGAGVVQAFLVVNGGEGYAATDTITITDSGTGAGATATLTLGPQTGTYPGGAAYFQQRRYYFNTLNAPDTYFASQPGSFTDFDSSVPVTASDAIIGTPWSQQINGIQAMVPEQSGLVILTGSGAWQLTGGAQQTAVTPADQDATPQAYNGISPIVPPIPINYDIIYVQCKGSIVRDIAYNFFVNIYTGTDKTEISNHLFTNYQILQWAYAEEPYKVVWAIRSDGTMLSLTYLKEEDVYGWARHDTNGTFVSVVSVTEPPVDAVYMIVQRFIQAVNNGVGQWVYYSERMDNRIWPNSDQAWCVDCGLTYPQNYPSATLSASNATGGANITAANVILGGSGYVSPVASAVDPTGAGSGATFNVTVVAGVITAVAPVSVGSGYSQATQINIIDAGGGIGAVVNPVITNIVSFTASAPVFQNEAGLGAAGDVINFSALEPGVTTTNHPGGGVAVVTQFISPNEVLANITQPITATIPNDPLNTPLPQVSGSWSIINPTATVTNLDHLDGMTVSILADGVVVQPQVVQDGTVNLPNPASTITVGLGFTAQLQTLYMDVPGMNPTLAGRRKQIPSLTVRTVSSRGVYVGGNQPDASAQPNGATVPWTGMTPVQSLCNAVPVNGAIPLVTGDNYAHPSITWNTAGQIALQITDPVPAEIVMLVPEAEFGDTPSA